MHVRPHAQQLGRWCSMNKLRFKWRDAVLESDLSTRNKMVALVFEWHASKGPQYVWVAPERLQSLTSLGRTAAKTAVRELVEAGWLTVTEEARQHRAARYSLTIPSVSDSDPLADSWVSDDGTRGSDHGISVSDYGASVSDSDPDPCPIPVLSPPHPQEEARHKHHPNAERALGALSRGRGLPMNTNELLENAYRLGSGDPWVGYLEIKTRTERSLEGARDPKAALNARLR